MLQGQKAVQPKLIDTRPAGDVLEALGLLESARVLVSRIATKSCGCAKHVLRGSSISAECTTNVFVPIAHPYDESKPELEGANSTYAYFEESKHFSC